jgi:hypothetical protein
VQMARLEGTSGLELMDFELADLSSY